MSQKNEKKIRRAIRKRVKYHYNEFLGDVSTLKFSDRFRIAVQVLKGKFKGAANG